MPIWPSLTQLKARWVTIKLRVEFLQNSNILIWKNRLYSKVSFWVCDFTSYFFRRSFSAFFGKLFEQRTSSSGVKDVVERLDKEQTFLIALVCAFYQNLCSTVKQLKYDILSGKLVSFLLCLNTQISLILQVCATKISFCLVFGVTFLRWGPILDWRPFWNFSPIILKLPDQSFKF